MACFNASMTLTETALKDLTHQITRSCVDIATIWHVKRVDKDTRAQSSDRNSTKSTKASPRTAFVNVSVSSLIRKYIHLD